MPIASLLTPELREMLETNDNAGLHAFCEAMHAASTAEFLEELTPEEIWRVLDRTDPARQAAIFEYLPNAQRLEMVRVATRERMARLLDPMAHDDRVDLLKELDPERRDEILPLVAQAEREDIRQLLSYSEDSVGAVMTTDYAWFREDITAGEAISQLRHQAPERETIYYVYVLDVERRLLGVMTLTELIRAKPSAKLGEFMKRNPVTVRVDENKEQAARTLARYDVAALPVVDDADRLVGIITHDDVMDVVVQAATEDVHRLGAVEPVSETYLETSFVTLWRKRAFWLSCLFIAELFTFTALAHFEDAIAAIVALSLFVPLCISTGGNSGSQAATLITRALALGQVTLSDWWRVLRHELLMGLALGLTLGVIGFLRASLTPRSVLSNADRWILAAVIGQSVAAICVWGTLVGSMLPLLFKRLGIDPGIASSPFVATFVDVTGIMIYFSIARVYLL